MDGKRVVRILERIDRKLTIICDAYIDGEARAYPWQRLHPVRQRQVLAVRDCLARERTRSVKSAAKAVFRRVRFGYPSWEALAAHCYRIGIGLYVGRTPR